MTKIRQKMKVAGVVPYPFMVYSQSDTVALGFDDEKTALKHIVKMNSLIATWPNNPWNTDYWKERPQEWVIESCA